MSAEKSAADVEETAETKSISIEPGEDQDTPNMVAVPAVSTGTSSETGPSPSPDTGDGAASSSFSTTTSIAGAVAATDTASTADTASAADTKSFTSTVSSAETVSSTTATRFSGQASAETTPTTSSTPSISPSATKTNAGALAGGIIGAFFGGAILALMAAYIFSQRRKSSPYKPRGSKAVESSHGASTRKSLGPRINGNAWERLIPQPVDDETMSSLVKSLLDRVVLHVDNFYARKSVQISSSDLESFARADTQLLPKPLPEMMMDPNMQMLAIKHCIAFALTDSITPGDDPSNKILPIYLAALPRKLAADPKSENDMTAERQAYAVWKTVTSCLLPKLADEPIPAEHRRQVTISIIANLSAAFRNWEVSSDNGERAAQNLSEIVGVAFDVGMRIASQACSSTFEWQQRRRRTDEPDSFVVLPGFNKVVDERGNLIKGPQVLVRPTTYRPRRER